MPLPADAGVGTNVPYPPHMTGGGTTVTPVLDAALVVLAVNFALISVWGVRRLFLDRPTFRRTWSFADLWIGIQAITALLTASLLPLYMFVPGLNDPTKLVSNLAFILPATVLQNVIFFAVPVGFIAGKYQMPLRAIGLPPLPRRRDVLLGIALGLGAILVSLPLEAGLSRLAQHYQGIPFVDAGLKMDDSQPINALIASVTKQGWGVLLAAFVAIGPGPGLGEEMLFRGFLFNLFKHRVGVWPGIFLSGLIFAAVHGYFVGFIPVFLLGIALAVTYQRTGSLWTSIFFHATNNGVLVLLAYFFPSIVH